MNKIKYYLFLALSLTISTNLTFCMHDEDEIDLVQIKIEEHSNVASYETSNNGKFLLLKFNNNMAKIINLTNNKEKTFNYVNTSCLNTFSNNSKFLILSFKNGSIKLIDLEIKSILEFNNATDIQNVRLHNTTLSNDGNFLLVAYNDADYLTKPFYSGTIEIIELENGQYASFENVNLNNCTFSPDSKFLIITKQNNSAELIKLENAQAIKTFGNIKNAVFSENSETLSIEFNDDLNETELFDLKDYIIVKKFKKNLLNKCYKKQLCDIRITTL